MNTDQGTGLIALFGGREAGRLIGVMMEAGFREAGLNYRYATIPVEEGSMEDILQAAETFHMKGFNLDGNCTKEIVPFLDMMSPSASMIGEVNSVRVQDGMLIGENSIGKGLVSSLMETGFSIQGKKICILGSGKAARAVAVECAVSGAGQIVILCRNKEEGEKIAWMTSSQTDAAVTALAWEGRASIPVDTEALINCTPLGLTDLDLPDVDYGQINEDMVVCDMVLGKPDTAFLKACRERGAQTVAGLDIMVAQASLNFFLWTEAMFPRNLMRDALLEEIKGTESAGPGHLDAESGERLMGDQELIEKIMEYFMGYPGKIQHLLKVYEFAKLIGHREGLEESALDILKIAALLSSFPAESDRRQEEGRFDGDWQAVWPEETETLLRELGYDDLLIDRALYLIDNHYAGRKPDSVDSQILLEADWLVRLYEDDCNADDRERVRKELFRSPSGLGFFQLLYPESR